MGLISVNTGNVYQFTTLGDDTNSVAQIAGTQEVYNKTFLTGLQLSSSASLTLPAGSTALFAGTNTYDGVIKHNYTSTTAATSSLTTAAQWDFTGSFLAVLGASNHMALLGGTGFNDYVFKYIKSTSNSNLIMISSSIGISGKTQWSSSDAWAAIEVVQQSLEWIITSKVGNWY